MYDYYISKKYNIKNKVIVVKNDNLYFSDTIMKSFSQTPALKYYFLVFFLTLTSVTELIKNKPNTLIAQIK